VFEEELDSLDLVYLIELPVTDEYEGFIL
jgi:hypothetical protein